MDTKNTKERVIFAFDVGHHSLGWSVIKPERSPSEQVAGCGVVLFPKDDCLASQRRVHRRQRRHIYSTKLRIQRLREVLVNLGVMTDTQADRSTSSSPWKLAAMALAGAKTLDWPQLWDVLRWYAQNRGYDGNMRWARSSAEESEDTEKELLARSLMDKYGTESMAETICQLLDVPLTEDGRSSSTTPFKTLGAAFPRSVVVREVRSILKSHIGHLPQLSEDLVEAISGEEEDDWKRADLWVKTKPAKRYRGSLLFGQNLPRFDNRIISSCPFTFARALSDAREAGLAEKAAVHRAKVEAKVPVKNCPEFYRYRWAMQWLANIRVSTKENPEARPLSKAERGYVDEAVRVKGKLTPSELKLLLKQAVEGVGQSLESSNLDGLLLHPDAKKALVFDEALSYVEKLDIAPFWNLLEEEQKVPFLLSLRKFKPITRRRMRDTLKSDREKERFQQEAEKIIAKKNKSASFKKRGITLTLQAFLDEPLAPAKPSGRAPYARPILRQAVEEVLQGKDPRSEGGCLYRSPEVLEAEERIPLDQKTNNHLLRHRLLVLKRLVRDMTTEFIPDPQNVHVDAVVEVNSDLREFSGLSRKQIEKEMKERTRNFRDVEKRLRERLQGKTINGAPIRIGASLIRKARIAEDLGWKCPFTELEFDAVDLVHRRVDLDHIIPRSKRNSNSLDSLVVTFSEVNRMKDNRTALEFIRAEGGRTVENAPHLSITTEKRFRALVEKLSVRGHPQDSRRKRNRKRWLLTAHYNPREAAEFTPAQLTATSQLTRLAAKELKAFFQEAKLGGQVHSLPGQLTAMMRRDWDLLGCLARANPQVKEHLERARRGEDEPLTKSDVRGMTHMHHALDAVVLGLGACRVPNNGRVWELLLKHKLNETEARELRRRGAINAAAGRRPELKELPAELKNAIGVMLAQRRVYQHIPRSMSGLKAEENIRGIVDVQDGKVILKQKHRTVENGVRVRAFSKELSKEKPEKLLGLQNKTGKLGRIKGALVIKENFGVALDPQPQVIPHHAVWRTIMRLREKNGGNHPRILRLGQLIYIPRGIYRGHWMIRSIIGGDEIKLRLSYPDTVKGSHSKTGEVRDNVYLNTLIKDGLVILEASYTATPAENG